MSESKSTLKEPTVKLLKVFPRYYMDKKLETNLEEGHLTLSLPDINMEVRNIKYHIREDKHVRIIMPYVVYTKSKEDDKKQLKVSVPSFHMTDPSVWKMVIEKMKELLLKNYEDRDRERKTEEVSNDA
jgi:hypothetical protein